MKPPDHDRRRRQGWWLGLAGLLGSAALALLSGLAVEFAADWLTTTRAAWTIAGLAVVAVSVAAWQVYTHVIAPPGHRPPDRDVTDPPHSPDPARTRLTAGTPVLPADIAEFVGRREQLAKTVELAGKKPVIATVGRRGVGTSAFVLHAAHQLRDRHPDAQVHLDVRPGDRPLKPEQVLARVCRTLRLPEPRSGRQADLDAAGEQLRGWLARNRVLLVLHNIDDPEQVRHALPGVGYSTALLAGTPDLRDLEGVHCLPLEEPTVEEAVELLARLASRELVDAHPRSAEELVRLCGQQPLAVRLLGRKLRDHEWTVERLRRDFETAVANPAYQVQVEGSDALRALWGTCDVAYQRLDRAQQRMFRLLGLAPATEIGVPATAALAGLTTRRAQRLLEELADLGFVESAGNGRYRLRESLMRSARLHLDAAESPRRQLRALIRVARHLTGRAAVHATALTPVTRRESVEQDLARAQANAWFRDEQDLLHGMIAERRSPGDPDASPPPTSLQRQLFRMAVPLCLWYAAEQQLDEWREACQAIFDTPLARADPAVASWARNELGAVLRLQGDPAAASDHLAAALSLRPARLRAERSQVEINLGLAWLDRRDAPTAMNHFERARRLHGDRYGRALGDLGWGAAHLHDNTPGAAPLEDRLAAARRSFERCFEVFTELGEQRGLAAARNNLGLVLWRQGDHTGAEENWGWAEAIYTGLEDEAGLARVRLNQAAMLLTGRPDRLDEAVDRLRESLQLRAGSADTIGTGLCHLHLGTAYAAQGVPAQAQQAWQKAERIFSTLKADAELAEAKERLKLLDEGERQPRPRPAPPPRPGRPRWKLPDLSGWRRWFPLAGPRRD